MLRLEEVKNYILNEGKKILIKESSNLYPMFSESSYVFGEGSTIYIEDNIYHYVIMERGKEIKLYKSDLLDEILYPLFKNITSSLAQKFELEYRHETDDFRKLLWKKQIELLEIINEDFAKIRKKEIEDILKIAPFRDAI